MLTEENRNIRRKHDTEPLSPLPTPHGSDDTCQTHETSEFLEHPVASVVCYEVGVKMLRRLSVSIWYREAWHLVLFSDL